MFDRLLWWQLLLLLSPIVLTMYVIRHRENVEQGVDFRTLSNVQKSWLFMTMLPPGTMASLLSSLKPEARAEMLAEASKIQGNRRTAAVPVAREFLASVGETRKIKSSEPSEMMDWVSFEYDNKTGKLLASINNCWPVS